MKKSFQILLEAQQTVNQLVKTSPESGAAVSELIALFQKTEKRFDRILKQSDKMSTTIIEQKDQLQATLDQLKKSQDQLIQSEKLASLGKLVASVAHEINTPIGAIKSTVDNSLESLDFITKNLHHILSRLDQKAYQSFFCCLQRSTVSGTRQTAKEKRSSKKQLNKSLSQLGIQPNLQVVNKLIRLEIYENLDNIADLLSHNNCDAALDLLSHLVLQKSKIQNIDTAVERMSKIVFALKNYSNFGTGNQQQLLNLEEGIRDVVILYAHLFEIGVTLIEDYQPVGQILGNKEELAQVWLNLIYNSLQAMAFNGTLELSVFQKNESVVVRIKDNGPGIPKEIQEKIFEPFFTTKNTGEGSGLGLAIVRQIIDKHKGTISLQTKPGEGTTFMVKLPTTDEPQENNE